MADKNKARDVKSTAGEHALTSKIRDIVEHPEQHSVGELAAAVDQALTELMMFRERLDLLDSAAPGAKGRKTPSPVSGSQDAATPGKSRRAV